jgi:hypothetical protein
MPSYGLLTNPSNDITSEISKIHELNFDYVEIGIEGPEGNPNIINKKKNEVVDWMPFKYVLTELTDNSPVLGLPELCLATFFRYMT